MLEKIKKALAKRQEGFFKKSPSLNLSFKSNEFISVGVEIELHVVDKETLELTSKADELLDRLGKHTKQFVPELLKSQIEINSKVHKNVNELANELDTLLKLAMQESNEIGCEVVASGSYPFGHYHNIEIRTSERYQEVLKRNQWTSRRWAANGMHIHLGMQSEQEFIRFMLFFEHYIPHFIALSASSPFWQGFDTGLDSSRSVLGDSMPTAPLMYSINSWSKFKGLARTLKRADGIRTLSDLHWDIRPNTGFGTLEIRVLDMPTNLQDILALVGLIHTMALWFADHGEWLNQMPKLPLWMARENKWRGLRDGLEAKMIKDDNGKTRPLREDLQLLLDRIRNVAITYNYEHYINYLSKIIEQGNAASRQRAVFEKTGDLKAVVDHVLGELRAGHPIYPEIKAKEAV